MKIIICKTCGKEFKNYESNHRKFCSNECYYKSKTGHIPWNKGTKGKTIAWNKGLKGYRVGEKHDWMPKKENHYNWQGGKSFEIYPTDWTEDLKESVRKRDNYICQECGIHQDELNMGQIRKLDVHHIDYDKKNCNPDNLITLCRKCHIKTNINREYWIEYFDNIKHES